MHAENRARLCARLRAAGAPAGSIVFLRGGAGVCRDDTDHEPLFRQESFFHWAFGVAEPDWAGAIRVSDGRAVLLRPRIEPFAAVWMGGLRADPAWRARYGVDAVHCVDDTAAALRGELGLNGPLLLLRGTNTDSGAEAKPARFAGDDAWPTRDETLLFPAIVEARVFKSAAELALLRHASDVSSAAHLAVMLHAAPGQLESQLESLFRVSARRGSSLVSAGRLRYRHLAALAHPFPPNASTAARLSLRWRRAISLVHVHLRERAQWRDFALRARGRTQWAAPGGGRSLPL